MFNIQTLRRFYLNEATEGGDGGGAPAAPAATEAPATTEAPAAPAAEPTTLLTGGDPAAAAEKPEGGNNEGEEGKEGKEAESAQVPESYEIKLPEGTDLAEATVPMLNDLFKDLGLTQEQADGVLNKLMEIDAARAMTPEQEEALMVQSVAKLNEDWAAQCKALPDIGGANFAHSLETCAQVMAKFATPELKQVLTYSGLGSNPEFFKFVHAIGSAMSSDTMHHGGESQGQRTHAQLLWPNQN